MRSGSHGLVYTQPAFLAARTQVFTRLSKGMDV